MLVAACGHQSEVSEYELKRRDEHVGQTSKPVQPLVVGQIFDMSVTDGKINQLLRHPSPPTHTSLSSIPLFRVALWSMRLGPRPALASHRTRGGSSLQVLQNFAALY